jgi:Fic family protein
MAPGNKRIFESVSSFLINERFSDLVSWVSQELEDDRFHPLYVIGTFHLLFLQIQPYQTANHQLCLAIVWHLLNKNGYSFFEYSHFAPTLLTKSEEYFNALRQAEKTAYGTWATLNVWLEFFLEVLLESNAVLSDTRQRLVGHYRLTPVQKQILQVVKTYGSATRERIARETGINVSTVKYNLSVLYSNGQLKREGGGRSTSYTVL